jgi:hypothetical protein
MHLSKQTGSIVKLVLSYNSCSVRKDTVPDVRSAVAGVTCRRESLLLHTVNGGLGDSRRSHHRPESPWIDTLYALEHDIHYQS